jgi:hypothetical protein
MPAFTFEKILPPTRHPHPIESKSSEPRGVMVRLLDRFVASPLSARGAGRDGSGSSRTGLVPDYTSPHSRRSKRLLQPSI